MASYNEHTIALCAPDAASGTALLSMEFLKDLRYVSHKTTPRTCVRVYACVCVWLVMGLSDPPATHD